MEYHTDDRRSRPRDAVAGEPPRAHLEALIMRTFREMPGLSLHLAQAARLFGLRVATCEVVLKDLVRRGDLHARTMGSTRRGDCLQAPGVRPPRVR